LTGLLLFTQFFIIFVFSTLDLLLFYFAFESVLIPLFFLVGIFGSRERRVKAAYYLMFYTLIGSLPLLLGILFVWLKTGQTNILVFEPLLLGLFDSTELSLL
jgi:NADH:ubiquinone oxidoreductase subunit 4 (subunit M)